MVCSAGVAVALGSDFNPNAFCIAMVSDLVKDHHSSKVAFVII